MKPFALALIAGILSQPLRAADAAPIAPTVVAEPFPPARFISLYIERDEAGSSTVIQLVGDAVIYTKTVGGKVVENSTAHPSADDWFQFIQGLNAAKVYKWAPQYEPPGQGALWAIDLATDDRKFSSEGAKEYPKEGAEAEPATEASDKPSVPFQLFWQAALTLVGKGTPPVAPK